MTVENLGVKLYSGLKSDRVSDSLGSSGDGVNTDVTLDTTNEKLGTGCYSLNGSTSKVVLGSPSDWAFLSNATANKWSIAWWMIYDDTLENGHTIMSLSLIHI